MFSELRHGIKWKKAYRLDWEVGGLRWRAVFCRCNLIGLVLSVKQTGAVVSISFAISVCLVCSLNCFIILYFCNPVMSFIWCVDCGDLCWSNSQLRLIRMLSDAGKLVTVAVCACLYWITDVLSDCIMWFARSRCDLMIIVGNFVLVAPIFLEHVYLFPKLIPNNRMEVLANTASSFYHNVFYINTVSEFWSNKIYHPVPTQT